jgi:hypothetical protein
VNQIVRQILEAVRDDRVLEATRGFARRLLAQEDERERELVERRAAAKAAREARPKKKVGGATAFHKKVRRQEELAGEEVGRATWSAVLDRTAVDHRGRHCCEACHKLHALEPHHLMLGAGGRVDEPELVMALCADCHRMAPGAAHRAPRTFAQTIVIPWAAAHRYPLPNRKEYRA